MVFLYLQHLQAMFKLLGPSERYEQPLVCLICAQSSQPSVAGLAGEALIFLKYSSIRDVWTPLKWLGRDRGSVYWQPVLLRLSGREGVEEDESIDKEEEEERNGR